MKLQVSPGEKTPSVQELIPLLGLANGGQDTNKKKAHHSHSHCV